VQSSKNKSKGLKSIITRIGNSGNPREVSYLFSRDREDRKCGGETRSKERYIKSLKSHGEVLLTYLFESEIDALSGHDSKKEEDN